MNESLKVQKRDGRFEPFNPNKILSRIKTQAKGLSVSSDYLFLDVAKLIGETMSSIDLDELIVRTAASKKVEHPDYGILAAKIAASRLSKECMFTMLEIAEKSVNSNKASGLNDIYVERVRKYGSALDELIVDDRDYNFDIFGLSTLIDRYLLKVNGKVIERPQQMYLRVALVVADDNLAAIKKTYDLLSEGYYSHATPTMMNAGRKKQQLASCFLLETGDNLESLMDDIKDMATLSKYAGGLGVSVTPVRAAGSDVAGLGESQGLLPLFKTYEQTMKWFNQLGMRRGACAVYLEPWHRDFFTFLDLRKNSGKDEIRARDLFLGVWAPNYFFECVEQDLDWYMMCPNEILEATGIVLQDLFDEEFKTAYLSLVENDAVPKVKVKAQYVWHKIIEPQIETGMPYLLNKDEANLKSNQLNAGIIHNSNLCVTAETQVLTDKGYLPIIDVVDEEVNVWNGEQWSTVTPKKTGENQDIMLIEFSNGQQIKCTPYHKFYIREGYLRGTGSKKLKVTEVQAKDLVKGNTLLNFNLPTISVEDVDQDYKKAYTMGFFTGDGCNYNGKNHIDLYGPKIELADFLEGTWISSYNEGSDRRRLKVDSTLVKFELPKEKGTQFKLNWFAGLLDSDGTVTNNNGTNTVQISSINKPFLLELQLMLQTLGVDSKIALMRKGGIKQMPNKKGGNSDYYCVDCYRIIISAFYLNKLRELGLKTNRLIFTDNIPNRNALQFVKVVDMLHLTEKEDTYCLTEPIRGMVMFNGILTGNCAEILQVTNKDEIANCNLASICLPKFVTNGVFDFQKLYEVAYFAVQNTDNVIDVNYYPVERTRYSNFRLRPIGVGVQGLADCFALMRMPFDSEEAKELNKKIFAYIYYAGLQASSDKAKVSGSYSAFEGSPIQQGSIQPTLWGLNLTNEYNLDWKKLIKNIQKNGLRNSLITALMPTASTSLILDNNECFEPFTSNVYARKTLTGTFQVINKHLVKDLLELKMWDKDTWKIIVANKGSIITVNNELDPVDRVIVENFINRIPQEVKDLYKTVWEISMKTVIDMAADRAPFIDQTQSMNLFIAEPTVGKVSSMLMYAAKKKLKTLMYYLRTRTKVEADKKLAFRLADVSDLPAKPDNSLFDCVGCSA